MTLSTHFQKYQSMYEISLAGLFLLINASVQATTHIMDDRRANEVYSFYMWEPFVWELSSLALWLILIPLIVRVIASRYCSWAHLARTGMFLSFASIALSALHVTGMVLLRKFVYWTQDMVYDFGSVGYEFFYEYRKDVITLVLIVAAIKSYRFIISQLRGEASIVSDGEDNTQQRMFDRILVKKLGKEFVVKIEDIEWLEACGNYVNLHVKERIYPTRSTLNKLLGEISDKGFCRIHRSFGVNLDAVESIETHGSGSGEVTLKNGLVLNLSRRYHDELKQRLY